MAFLELDGLQKGFGLNQVVQGVSLAAEQGEFISFLGPSGCGKTTTLRMVAKVRKAPDRIATMTLGRITRAMIVAGPAPRDSAASVRVATSMARSPVSTARYM